MKLRTSILTAFGIIGAGLAIATFIINDHTNSLSPLLSTPTHTNNNPTVENKVKTGISPPITNALERMTLKPFGIYVSPAHSPVTPERFTGWHTGVDFETFPEEQDTDVSVYAICTGPLVLKKIATGYGGVIVQRCTISSQEATVVYGHLKLSSVSAETGEMLNSGDILGILGKGYSSETDGEHKHLHLGIHLGSATDISGYVKTSEELKNWLNISTLLE